MTDTNAVKAPKKLIEVALPLDAINEAAAREKSIRHGHPSTLHLWWARRPLAAARAVIFGQLVNDPSWKWEMEHPGEVPPNQLKASWAASRKRLFSIIEELVKWENSTNTIVLEKARAEIRKSWRETCELNKAHPDAERLFNPDNLPPIHDPFAGGGTIPLEGQRLGLEAYATDLNPVAVLINKAMIEIPPRFPDRAPIGPLPPGEHTQYLPNIQKQWPATTGLAEDVRRYGAWILEEARKKIGHLYPPIEITARLAMNRPDLRPLIGAQLTVQAWIWARTVKSPNPAFRHVDVPLISTFMLSSKTGSEAYLEPVVEGDSYRFTVHLGTPPASASDGTKLNRANFRCVVSGSPIEGNYIKQEGLAGRMGTKLIALVAESPTGRCFLPADDNQEELANSVVPDWRPDIVISGTSQYLGCKPYGFEKFSDLYSLRQTMALNVFSDLVKSVRDQVVSDGLSSDMSGDVRNLDAEGNGLRAYSEAISVYLACAFGRALDYWNTIATWEPSGGFVAHCFTRQAIRMVWDSAESNPFSDSSGNWTSTCVEWVKRVVAGFVPGPPGHAFQADAQTQSISNLKFVSTDPPYYDNVPYADISDFFYVWLRRTMREIYPDQFATLAVPKSEELVAFAYRHGSKELAEAFFLDGMTCAMSRLANLAHPSAPITIYYAFKQSETDSEGGTISAGWDTFLEAVNRSGLSVTGTWPMRTERANRSRGIASNALASSIILICRPRPKDAPNTSRRAFLRELNRALPIALDEMTRGSGDSHSPVAPVDLSQAIIGPGMAVFSKYSAVLEANGEPMSVRTAIELINRFLAEDDFDPATQFCLHWFEQHGWQEGKFGEADTLARAKGTSVEGVKQAGVVQSAAGVVRLLKWTDYAPNKDSTHDARLPVWEILHRLVRVLRTDGESAAGAMLKTVQGKSESTRQLAYRLYTLCERAGWAEDARAYNELITSWTAIEAAAANVGGPEQAILF